MSPLSEHHNAYLIFLIRLEEEIRQKQALEDDLAAREKERKRKDKLASGKAKLSFALDEVRAAHINVSQMHRIFSFEAWSMHQAPPPFPPGF